MTPSANALSASADEPHSGPFVARVNGYSVIDCKVCGFRHITPLPSDVEIAEIYNKDYYAKTKPNYLAHAKDDESWAALAYDDRLETIEKYSRSRNRRLVDIGSGPGSFLTHARAKGWEVRGLEPSRQAASHARDRGLDILEDFLTETTAQALAPANAVHLMNMLEHVPNPEQSLRLAASILSEGGVLCVGVPNEYNPLQRVMSTRGTPPWWVAPPHHINYFDFETLEGLVRKVGLVPRARLTSFPMEMFLAFGCNYVGDEKLGRACHVERRKFDVDLEQAAPGKRRALYEALAMAGFGREAIVIATKT